MVREEISNTFYYDLNEGWWYIEAKINNLGEINSIAFMFSHNLEIDIKEFSELAKRIKNETLIKPNFNKELGKETFFLKVSVRGPKL